MGYYQQKKLFYLMTQPPTNPTHSKPKGCRDCVHYRPTWKYRFCELTRCPFSISSNVFRKKPQKKGCCKGCDCHGI